MQNTDKPSILYVDDDQANLTAFKFQFRKFYAVNLASSGKEGLEIMQQHNIEVVIADQRMANMTGVEFLAQIASQYPLVNRILVTAYSDIDAVIQAINQAKVYHYVSKPWNKDYLKTQIDNAIEARRLKLENERLVTELQRQNLQLEDQAVEREYLIFELKSALDKIKQLSGLLPLCANCHKIRDDQDQWHPLEIYIGAHSEVDFTHGICPDCMQKLYPEFQIK